MKDTLHIVFVDEEPMALQALRRMLSVCTDEWTMYFTRSGQEALRLLEENPVRVIVTEDRASDMSGSALLREVMNRFPQVIRIILTGQTAEESILSVVNLAHLFISKPCSETELIDAIRHAGKIRSILSNPALRKLASSLETIPSVPSLYMQLIEELNSPNASMKRVGKIVSRDAGMTAKILQLVNSAFFGLPREVNNIETAVNLLGYNTLLALVLSAHVFAKYDQNSDMKAQLDEVFAHSLRTAAFARAIANTQQRPERDVNDAYIGGILHDIGRIILIGNVPEEYVAVRKLAEKEKLDVLEAERRILGATHAELGAYVLALWGLSDTVVEAALYHHLPASNSADGFSPAVAVYVADIINHALDKEKDDEILQMLDAPFLEQLGLLERVPVWMDVCGKLKKQGENR